MRIAIALILCLAAQDDADKEAFDLLEKIDKKAAAAKSLEVQGTLKQAPMEMTYHLRSRQDGRYLLEFAIMGGREKRSLTLKCDGRRLHASGDMPGRPTDHRLFQGLATRAITDSPLVIFYSLQMQDAVPPRIEARRDGAGRVEGVDATIVKHVLKIAERGNDSRCEVKSWIDAAKLVPLRREITLEGRTLEEAITVCAFDVELPDELFALQTAKTLAEGRTLQLQRSVELFLRFTGHLPRTLDDLAKRPEWLRADAFWPEGGFWQGALPKDVPYARDGLTAKVGTATVGPETRRAVAAPGERLANHFEAVAHVALLSAAIEAYHAAYVDMPADVAGLVERPEWAKVWPDGGFLPREFVRDASVRVEVKAAFARVQVAQAITLKSITAEERAAMEKAQTPSLSAEETRTLQEYVAALRSDKIEDRDRGLEGLRKWGGAATETLDAALAVEKDLEALDRLKALRKAVVLRPTWEVEMARTLAVVRAHAGGATAAMSSNERNASASIKTISTAQADFRANDRDGDMINNFWVKDVASLCGMGSEKGWDHAIKLIEPSVAMADATPGRPAFPAMGDEGKPKPKAGYLYAVLESYEEDGKVVPYHAGDGRHRNRFGCVAYPADYGSSGTRTFIISEENVIWSKDTLGEMPKTWPEDPAADGWQRVD